MKIENTIINKKMFVEASLKVRRTWDMDPRTRVVPNKKKAVARRACRKGVDCYA